MGLPAKYFPGKTHFKFFIAGVPISMSWGFCPSRCVPDGRFFVEKGGNCMSGGKATHLMLEPVKPLHPSLCADQQASFSPAMKNRPAGKQAARGRVSFATFL